MTDHVVETRQVTVLGKLSSNGVVKMQFGTSQRDDDGGSEMVLGNHLKAAASDSLRKCASLLGVGLYLWRNNASEAPAAQPSAGPASSPEISGATEKQLGAIYAIGRDRGLERDDIEVRCRDSFGVAPEELSVKEASAFIDHLNALARRPAA